MIKLIGKYRLCAMSLNLSTTDSDYVDDLMTFGEWMLNNICQTALHPTKTTTNRFEDFSLILLVELYYGKELIFQSIIDTYLTT